MNRKAVLLTASCLLSVSANALACEYKSGETKFLDYANCRYGEDNIEVINLPESSNWETCIYHLQAFRPEKLLAVTKQDGDKEMASINDRSQIGNPCYLTKQHCDQALEASKH
jgi:hypothetical protein